MCVLTAVQSMPLIRGSSEPFDDPDSRLEKRGKCEASARQDQRNDINLHENNGSESQL